MLLTGKKLMMFEDNIENITVQTAFLEQEGAQVDIFVGGTLEDLVRRLPVDVIIMDLMMPGDMDGFDFFEMLKGRQEFESIPIVAVSAMDASLAVSKSKSMGFAGFIAKPVDAEQFPSQIASILNGKPVWDANRR
ncbi:MAG: response regulator [Cyanobacteria bacterium J06626_14]